MTEISGDEIQHNDEELNSLLESLSEESRTLVKIISLIMTSKLKIEMDTMKQELSRKDQKINTLNGEIEKLKEKVKTSKQILKT